MGHAYPENENQFVNEGLKFLCKQETLVDSVFESEISNVISSGFCRGLSVAVNDKGNTFYYNYGRAFYSGAESPDQKTLIFPGILKCLPLSICQTW
jgi:hypothetical protein